MNQVRKHLNEVADSITSVSFRVNCKAYAGKFSCPVKIEVEGMEDERENKAILHQVKEAAVNAAIKDIDLEILHDVIEKMDYDPICKSWAASVI